MNKTIKLSDIEIIELYKKYKNYLTIKDSNYIKYQFKKDNGTITIYNTNKAVFSGKISEEYDNDNNILISAGSDEVGTGDFFGPIIVVASIVEESNFDLINSLKIDDSKKISDDYILKIGETLIKNIKHSQLILDNKKYNEVIKKSNMNKIKALMHNQSYINLKNKYYLPTKIIVDQFTPENLYYKYLSDEKEIIKNITFETKAESKYISVAISSIIARYLFLIKFEEMSKKYNFDFIKGASSLVDKCAANFSSLYGEKELENVAKLNFKNIEKMRAYL